ncbi:SRPBCC family protein [Serratia ficaria]|uniref:SRPBCC family protein n=1 Tax=Serratia ficaria TaxID=61651 RepID=UPI002ED350BB|nr:SRPBCC family protein [Serratia ficaria]
MFTWAYTEEVATQATPDQIWAMWQDTASWPCWDSELEWVKLDGDFIVGTLGHMKPAGGPEVKFRLSQVIPNRSFSDVAHLPLTRLVFDHEYIPPMAEGGEARIRHTVTMSGLLAPVFGRVIGGKIKSHLRQAMLELSQRALTGDKTLR